MHLDPGAGLDVIPVRVEVLGRHNSVRSFVRVVEDKKVFVKIFLIVEFREEGSELSCEAGDCGAGDLKREVLGHNVSFRSRSLTIVPVNSTRGKN